MIECRTLFHKNILYYKITQKQLVSDSFQYHHVEHIVLVYHPDYGKVP